MSMILSISSQSGAAMSCRCRNVACKIKQRPNTACTLQHNSKQSSRRAIKHHDFCIPAIADNQMIETHSRKVRGFVSKLGHIATQSCMWLSTHNWCYPVCKSDPFAQPFPVAHLAVSLKCEDVCGNSVQEPAVVGNDEHGSRKRIDRIFQAAKRVNIKIVGRLQVVERLGVRD